MSHNLKKPSFLKTGDKIGIVSTARKISLDELRFAIRELESWGLEVVLGKTIGLSHDQFAGSDIERANDLQEMMDSPDIKAIFCARGVMEQYESWSILTLQVSQKILNG